MNDNDLYVCGTCGGAVGSHQMVAVHVPDGADRWECWPCVRTAERNVKLDRLARLEQEVTTLRAELRL